MKILLRLSICLTLLIACSDDEPTEVSMISSTPFYPLTTGHTLTYQVDQVVIYDEGLTRDSSSYLLQEIVADSYVDNGGATVHLIDQYQKSTTQEEWEYHQRISLSFRNNQLIRTEMNIPIIIMDLPINDGQIWDNTALFDSSIEREISGDMITFYQDWTGEYLSTDGSEMIGDLSFDSVVSISTADFENRLALRRGTEKYAKDVGLIYQGLMILDTQCFDACQNVPWEEKAETGLVMTKQIIAYDN